MTTIVLHEAKAYANKLGDFNPQPFERLKWLLNYLINVEEVPESEREVRVTALLSGEIICTNFSAFKLVKEERQ